MQLTDMKCKPGEYPAPQAMAEQPAQKYPFGLRIYLDDESLDKLGVENLPELGAEFTIQAKVRVVSKNESRDANDEDGDNDYQSMDLQITALALGLKKSEAQRASEMYSEKK